MYSNIYVTKLSAEPSWIDELWSHVGPFQKPTFSPVHTKNEVFSKQHVSWNRFGKFSFLSVFRAFYCGWWAKTHQTFGLNRKRISVDSALDNELSLIFPSNWRTSELRVRLWKSLPAMKADTRAEGRRKAGDVKPLALSSPSFLINWKER